MNLRLSVGLILIGLFASITGAFIFLDSYNQKEKERYFNSKAHELSLSIEVGFKRKEDSLRGLSGFFHASSFVDLEEWKTFEVNSSSLREGESTGFIFFNGPGKSEILKKYGQDPNKKAPIVYTLKKDLIGIDTGEKFQNLDPGTILKAPEIFNDERNIIVWPFAKGDQKGCFYLTYFEEDDTSRAAFDNLFCSLEEIGTEVKGLHFEHVVKLGKKEYLLVIVPKKNFDAHINSLPYVAAISFIGLLILSMIIRIQAINKKKDRVLTEQLTHENKILEALNVRTSKYSGEKFFDKLALNLSEVFESDYCFVTEIVNDKELQTLSVFERKVKVDNICYLKAGTPCERVADGELVYHEDNIKTIYPEDEFFSRNRYELIPWGTNYVL